MNDELDSKTDGELSRIFATEVVGIWPENYDAGLHGGFCTDANAVLPWLEKWHGWDASWRSGVCGVAITLTLTRWDCPKAEAPTFARAAVIALLRAERASK